MGVLGVLGVEDTAEAAAAVVATAAKTAMTARTVAAGTATPIQRDDGRAWPAADGRWCIWGSSAFGLSVCTGGGSARIPTGGTLPRT